MSERASFSIFLPDESATTELGSELAPMLRPGDVILLKGSVGAGKSHLARAIIQERLGYPEDVPSPTYTLVQTYSDGVCEIFHADLYRLSDSSELSEIGLEDAFKEAICLVEWAERLGEDDVPNGAVEITLETKDDGRHLTISANAQRSEQIERVLTRTHFLIDSGWAGSEKSMVAGDLSSRTYQRLLKERQSAILMDAGNDKASTQKFIDMSRWLIKNGYSAPVILAENAGNALIMLEDFGNEQLSKRLDVDDHMSLCLAFLADVRSKPAPALPCPSNAELCEMTALASHYPGADCAALKQLRHHLLSCLEKVTLDVEPTVSLRDFHTDNIMWLDERPGLQRLGLLDFQDAFLVHPVYDLVSLLTDARREVSQKTRHTGIADYATMTGDDLKALQAAFAVFSVQRNLRILGIFARAALELGKPHHVPNIPRVYGYLAEALEHPIFEKADFDLLAALPNPDCAFLDRLAS